MQVLINPNPLEKAIHSPQLNSVPSHRSAQFVVGSQISVTRNDGISSAIYGCCQHRLIPGIAAPRWHRSKFHHVTAKTELPEQSLRIFWVDPPLESWAPPHLVQFIDQGLAHHDGELVGLPCLQYWKSDPTSSKARIHRLVSMTTLHVIGGSAHARHEPPP
jgi:hypothetical protein